MADARRDAHRPDDHRLGPKERNRPSIKRGNSEEHRGRTARKKVFGSKDLMELAIGIEPTTFSLGNGGNCLISLACGPRYGRPLRDGNVLHLAGEVAGS